MYSAARRWFGLDHFRPAPNHVLRAFSATISSGDLLFLVGRNGVGKSVLGQCMSGIMPIDSGTVIAGGRRYTRRTPADPVTFTRRQALACGIDYVPQFLACPRGVTGTELLSLGTMDGHIHRATKIEAAARRRADQLGLTLNFSLRTDIAHLPLPSLQKLYLLRAAMGSVRLLILDEPTAMLTTAEANEVAQMIDALRDEGVAVLLIAHPGQSTAALTTGRNGAYNIVQFGPHGLAQPSEPPVFGSFTPVAERIMPRRPWVCELDLNVSQTLKDRVRAGEIVNIQGPATRAFFTFAHGFRGLPGRCRRIQVLPRDASVSAVFLPFHAREQWLVPELDLLENCLIGHLRDSRWTGPAAFLSRRAAVENLLMPIVTRLNVQPRHPRQPLAHLSGGNRQRLLVARTLYRELDVLVACDIDYGLDDAGSEAVGRMLEGKAAQGMAIILFSTTPDFASLIANRVYEFDPDTQSLLLQKATN